MIPNVAQVSLLLLASLLPTHAALVERQAPSCTTSCMVAQDRSACASNSDNKCLCKQPAFTFNMYTCLTDKCSSGDLASAISAVEGMCRINGASVTLGPGGGGGGSTPSSTGAGSSPTDTKKGTAMANSVNPWLVMTAAGLVGLAL
ncbi:hypothetical protein BJ165DRAFT_575348 [Panaeolus papilionaceus]|nr:hypothetical protein BJ165DRAFT_575348 [Panaeolus papilionaceus]